MSTLRTNLGGTLDTRIVGEQATLTALHLFGCPVVTHGSVIFRAVEEIQPQVDHR